MIGVLLALITVGTAYDISREMTDDSRPMWRRAFWSLGHFVAAVILAGMLSACASAPSPPPPPTPRPVGPSQLSTVVRVEALCIDNDIFETQHTLTVDGEMGSGVMVDSRHVLTASHVVSVNMGAGAWRPCSYHLGLTLVLQSGKHMRAVLVYDDPERDLALLELATGDSFHVAPVVYGPKPAAGDVVCHANGYPEWSVDCGQVTTTYPNDKRNNVLMTARVEHGNSGGPVYDSEGRLVGITTAIAQGGGGYMTGVP